MCFVDWLAVVNISFLLPPVDPPTHCGRTHALLLSDRSGRLPANPHRNKIGAFSVGGWLAGVSLHASPGGPT